MYSLLLNVKDSFLLLLCLLLLVGCNHRQSDYVNPFIGTENGGHTFVGATVPFGMVKLGPDYGERQSNSGYYESLFMQKQNSSNPNHGLDTVLRKRNNKKIQGFSHTHVSGTGGGPKYGNILIKPAVGNIKNLVLDYSSFRDSLSEKAGVGYYSVILNNTNKIKVELTATHNIGFHKYTFPKTDSAYILFDVTSFLGKYHCCGENQELVKHSIKIVNDKTLCGYSTVKGGWNKGGPYTVYFYAKIDKKADSYGAWNNEKLYVPEQNTYDTISQGMFYKYSFTSATSINVKVGISFLSIDKARINYEQDHNTFAQALKKAKKKWESYLSRIIIKTNADSLDTIFYTALYHSLLMPVNRTGENPNWGANELYYDDFYSIWDTYRTLHPLLTIIAPEKQSEIIQSLINIYIKEGYMPDARSGNYNGRTQGGSNSDILISEAYQKKIGIGIIDYQKAFEAMIKNAEKMPIPENKSLNWEDTILYTQKEGRYVDLFYKDKGYLPADYFEIYPGKYVFKIERPASRTLEYAFCDWSIANIADNIIIDSVRLFFPDDFDFNNLKSYYLKKSKNWMNLWNEKIECDGIKGFIGPRDTDGTWMYTLPDENGMITDYSCLLKGSWSGFFYESDAWENSLFVPHNVNGLIEICGGQRLFEKRLDIFFNKGHYKVKNEPSFLTPCLYSFIDKREKSVLQIRSILKEYYANTRGGIPGNDDSGAMSSWFVFNSIGLYPLAGSSEYIILSPLFKSIKIKANKNKFVIKAKNLSNSNIYPGKILLCGKEYKGIKIAHSEIIKRGKLKLYMQSE